MVSGVSDMVNMKFKPRKFGPYNFLINVGGGVMENAIRHSPFVKQIYYSDGVFISLSITIPSNTSEIKIVMIIRITLSPKKPSIRDIVYVTP